MNYNEILTLVLASVGTAGGLGTLAAIATTIVKSATTMAHTRALNKNTKAVTGQTDTIVEAINNNLSCTIEVDVAAQIEPVVEEIRTDYINQIHKQNDLAFAHYQLTKENTLMLLDSPRIGTDDKKRIMGMVADCDDTIVKAEPAVKGKLEVVMKKLEPKEVIEAIKNAPIEIIQV